jgi:uncharacterized tellurite resistance protein B-like protein
MIGKLRQILEEALAGTSPTPASGHDLRVATAALLLEMARADRDQAPEERDAALGVLTRHFALEQDAAQTLLERAEGEVEGSVSLYEFTSVLNETLSSEERRRIVELVAEVAAADGHFDKHEQHLLSKLADLLHLRRAEYAVIRAFVIARVGKDGKKPK